MNIPKEIEEALFDQLLAHTLKVYSIRSLSELNKRQKDEYYRDVGLLRIVIDDVKKKSSIPEWFFAAPTGKHTPQPHPNEEPPF